MRSTFVHPRRFAAAALLGAWLAATSGPIARGEDFSGNDLRDIRVGMPVAELPERGYQDFACAAAPERKLSGWSTWRDCPSDPGGAHAVLFGYDPLTARDGTMVAGHPVILTLTIDDDGRVATLQIVTDPKARLYLRKKAFLLGQQAKSRYGAEGWDCSQSSPSTDEQPVGGVYVKELCKKTTADRRLVIERNLFRRPGSDARSFIDETRISITQEKS
jgi:hypothetical protein